MNTHTWDLEKMVAMNLFAGQEQRHSHRVNHSFKVCFMSQNMVYFHETSMGT